MNTPKIVWPILVLAYMTLYVFGLIDNSRGPIYPDILTDFNIPPHLGQLIFSLCSLAGLLVTLSGNIWLPRFKTMHSLRFFLFCQAIGCMGMGFAGLYHYNFPLLLLSSIIMGLANGGIGIYTNLLISKSVAASLRRKTYAGLHAMYGIASLMAPLLLAISLKSSFQWTHHFLLLGVLPIGIIIASLLGKQEQIEQSLAVNKHKTSFLKIYPVCLMMGFYVASELIVSSRLVYYLQESYQWDKTSASMYLSIYFCLMLIGRFTFFLATPPGPTFFWLKISLITSFVLFILGLEIHPIALTGLGLTQSIFFPCAIDALYDKYGEYADAILPWVMTSATIILIIMHGFIGFMASILSIKTAMFLGPLFIAISLFFLFTEQRKIYSSSQTPVK